MYTRLTASVLGLALFTGCATEGYKKAEKTSDSLVDVKSELTADKSNLRTAVDDLNDLVYRPQNDLRPQYEKFDADVTALDKSAASSRASARNLVANREAHLSKWRSDTAALTDNDLRMRAMDRIAETEKHFTVVSEKVLDADKALSPLVDDLKAIRTYLGSDLTANGIKLISDRATGAKNRSIAVNQKIDAAVSELDKVSDTIAPMPATQSTTGTPSGM